MTLVDGSTPEGTKALRDYLEYARSGALTVAEDSEMEPDSDFEVAVIEVLRGRGYEVTPQLGIAGYRIDLAVKHPDAPAVYLAAIECDGASYHSALSVRDRDRIRQEILRFDVSLFHGEQPLLGVVGAVGASRIIGLWKIGAIECRA
jgi:hypothetical protein